MNRGVWRAIVHGVTESQTRPSTWHFIIIRAISIQLLWETKFKLGKMLCLNIKNQQVTQTVQDKFLISRSVLFSL